MEMKHHLFNKLSVKKVEIIPTITLEEDIENIKFINSIESEIVQETTYVVKIWLDDILPFSSLSVDLYLNDYKVRKYFEFDRGIYFKVFNPRFFEKHSDKKIYFIIGNSEIVETDWRLPSFENEFKNNIVPGDLQSLVTFNEAFK